MMPVCSTCCTGKGVVRQSRGVTSDYVYNNSTKSRTKFYCCGSVPPAGLYRKRHGMYAPGNIRRYPIEDAEEADENFNYGTTRIESPEMPYDGQLPEQLYVGRTVEIKGRVLSNANIFSIDLSTDGTRDTDIGLHFNPRLDRRIIIRNHRARRKWGREEILSVHPFPFKLNKNFSIVFFVADEQFLIAVNNIHYCAFSFRIPVETLKYLSIRGNIEISVISHYDKTSYPPLILSKTPYVVIPRTLKRPGEKCMIKRKIKLITIGTKIEITGRLKVLPTAFYINIQDSIDLWPHPIIPFHMNLRIYQPGHCRKLEEEVIFNQWKNGSWGREEVVRRSPFVPGSPFHLAIQVKPDYYTIHINSQFYYKYGATPATEMSSLVVYGDVIIHKVTLRY